MSSILSIVNKTNQKTNICSIDPSTLQFIAMISLRNIKNIKLFDMSHAVLIIQSIGQNK